MAGKIYDIMNRINKAKPIIKLAEDVEFPVNNSMAGAIAMKAISKDKDLEEFDSFKKIIAIGIGKEGLKYVEKQDYSVMDWSTIATAIMAAISEEELEDMEKKLEGEPKNV